jgi:hypothetical protein
MKSTTRNGSAKEHARWDRVWMALIMVGTFFPPTSIHAASSERGSDVSSESRGLSSDKLAQGEQLAVASIAKTQIPHSGMGFQLPAKVTPGEKAANDLQSQIRALRSKLPQGAALSKGTTKINFANGNTRQIEEQRFAGGITATSAQDFDSKGKLTSVTNSNSRSLTSQDGPFRFTYTGADGANVYTERTVTAVGALSVYSETTWPNGVTQIDSFQMKGGATVTESARKDADGKQSSNITIKFQDGLYISSAQTASADGTAMTSSETVGRNGGPVVNPYTAEKVQYGSDGSQTRTKTTVSSDGTVTVKSEKRDSKGNKSYSTTITEPNPSASFKQTTSKTLFSDGATQTTITRSTGDLTVTDTVRQYASGTSFKTHSETRGANTVTTTNFSDGRYVDVQRNSSRILTTTRYPDGRIAERLQTDLKYDSDGRLVSYTESRAPKSEGKTVTVITENGIKITINSTFKTVDGKTMTHSVYSDGRVMDAVTVTRYTVFNSQATGKTQTFSVVVYPTGEKQYTETTVDSKTGQTISANSRLVDTKGRELARSESSFLYMKDGSVQVNTVLTEGTVHVQSVAILSPNGKVTINGKELDRGTGDSTDFRTTIDAKGNMRREFVTHAHGNVVTTGVEENNIIRSVSVSPTLKTETVSTKLADGTVKSTSVSRITDADGFVQIITSNELATITGVTASLSPFEPARVIGKKVSSQIQSTVVLEAPGWSKVYLQSIAALVSGGTKNTITGETAGKLTGVILMPDGRKVTYAATYQPTVVKGQVQLAFQLTFSDGMAVTGVSIKEVTSVNVKYLDGSRRFSTFKRIIGTGMILHSQTSATIKKG